MRTTKWCAVVALLGAVGLAPSTQALQTSNEPPSPRVDALPDGNWCQYPTARPKPPLAGARVVVNEVEPNDTPGTAQVIPLGDGGGQDRDLDISGSISINSDTDYYRFTAVKGDVLGMAVLGGGAPDSILAVTDLGGTEFLSNDDHRNIAGLYPPTSPLPGGSHIRDSVLSWVAPADGDYLARVTSWNQSSSGPYTLQIRSRRGGLESEDAPATQIIFVDFDGASINAPALFGQGNNPANLSPLSSFLSGWGLSAGEESAVIDAILGAIAENFDDLRIAGLNGDRDTDGIDGHFDVEILNSRDHADPFGAANVSRLIIGGTINQLGISTIGIAQYIDPGNFGQESTAVILLDLLSASAPNANSINSIPLDPSMSKIDAVGLVTGNIAMHEAGHYLGNWHTENGNATRSIMDQGGNIPINIAGVGPDGILGTADDQDVDFSTDAYEAAEGVATGTERTEVRTAFGLGTGAAGSPCTSAPDCDDGLTCNGAETCDLVTSTCQPGTPVDCDDSVACTTDSCVEPDGSCSNVPDNGACDDSDPCTSDTCDAGLGCLNDPIDPCCGDGVCAGQPDEDCNSCPADCVSGGGTPGCDNGVCEPGEDCNSCPADCRQKTNGNPNSRYCCDGDQPDCGDARCSESGWSCGTSGVPYCCGDGVCEGAEDEANCPVDCVVICTSDGDCDDGDACNGAETCDVPSGNCQPGTAVDCDDANVCTTDSCDPGSGSCANDPITCDDGDDCTTDSCDSGIGCVADPVTACGPAEGCCPPGCDSSNDPDCGCVPLGGSCVDDGDCCTNKCRGRPGSKTCK